MITILQPSVPVFPVSLVTYAACNAACQKPPARIFSAKACAQKNDSKHRATSINNSTSTEHDCWTVVRAMERTQTILRKLRDIDWHVTRRTAAVNQYQIVHARHASHIALLLLDDACTRTWPFLLKIWKKRRFRLPKKLSSLSADFFVNTWPTSTPVLARAIIRGAASAC